MLIQATREDIRRYADAAYTLALKPESSCYPTYCDGIKTKADFLRAAEAAQASGTSELLLFQQQDRFKGWLSYDWVPEDAYLQLTGCSVAHGINEALSELLDRLEAQFAGYTAYFGFPGENREALHFLSTRGFTCIEQDWNHSFFFADYVPYPDNAQVERITHQNFEKFRAVYHADAETYWNCDRIYASLDKWTIFVYNQGSAPVAALFFTGRNGYYEIYGTEFAEDAFQADVFQALVTAALNACKCLNATHMTYLCGAQERHVLQKLGFKLVGQYLLYVRKL